MDSNTILVGTDFSELSKRAAIEAAHVATQLGYQIKLLHVIESTKMDPEDWPKDDEISSQLEAQLKEVRSYAEANGKILEGNAANLLAQESNKDAIAAVAIGYSGKSGLFERIGSIASKSARLIDKPLFVFAPNHQRGELIMGCIDYSSGSEKIAQWTHMIAKWEGAEKLFLHIGVPLASIIGSMPHLGSLGIPYASIPAFGISEEQYRTQLEQGVRDVEGIGADDPILVQLDTSDKHAISKLAEENETGLIVMGRHGHNSLHDRLLGSTAEHILEGSHCSVLILPSPTS